MCRALKIVCVAAGEPSLRALKHAAVGAEWELSEGATTPEEALAQLDGADAHVLVTWGAWSELVKVARERKPRLRIVAVGRDEVPEADVNITSIKQLRDAILRVPPPGGPVTT